MEVKRDSQKQSEYKIQRSDLFQEDGAQPEGTPRISGKDEEKFHSASPERKQGQRRNKQQRKTALDAHKTDREQLVLNTADIYN